LTTVQGLPKKFDQKKILKVIKKKFGKFPTLAFSALPHARNEQTDANLTRVFPSLQWHHCDRL
jgi:hypothetical protein